MRNINSKIFRHKAKVLLKSLQTRFLTWPTWLSFATRHLPTSFPLLLSGPLPLTPLPPRGRSVISKRKSWLFAFRSLFFSPTWTSVSSSAQPYAIYCPCTSLGISAYMTEWALTRYWPPLGWLWLERLIRMQGAASSLLTLRLNYSNITPLVYLWYSF